MKKYLKRSRFVSKLYYNYKQRKFLSNDIQSTKHGFKMYGPESMISGEFEKKKQNYF